MALLQTRPMVESNFLKDEESKHTGYCREDLSYAAGVADIARVSGRVVYQAVAGVGTWTDLPAANGAIAAGSRLGISLSSPTDYPLTGTAIAAGDGFAVLVRGRADVRWGGLSRLANSHASATDALLQVKLRSQGIEVTTISSLAQQVTPAT